MDFNSLQPSNMEDFEEKKNILFKINEESKMSKIKFYLLEKSYLRRNQNRFENALKRFNEMQITEQKEMDNMIRGRFEIDRHNTPRISKFHSSDVSPAAVSMRDSGLDVIRENSLLRSNCLSEGSKQEGQMNEQINSRSDWLEMLKCRNFFANEEVDKTYFNPHLRKLYELYLKYEIILETRKKLKIMKLLPYNRWSKGTKQNEQKSERISSKSEWLKMLNHRHYFANVKVGNTHLNPSLRKFYELYLRYEMVRETSMEIKKLERELNGISL